MAKCKKPMFRVDFDDLAGCYVLMQKYGDSEMPFFGKNERNEDVIISICRDSIAVQTLLARGGMLTSILHHGGEREELYEA